MFVLGFFEIFFPLLHSEGIKTAAYFTCFSVCRSALSDGYVHQFLFCFRYFLRAEDVFTFITQKYLAARRLVGITVQFTKNY